MGFQTAITAILLLLGVTYGKVDINFTGGWKENVGWELTCAWSLHSKPLQSVRLYQDDTQFLIYRPEKQGVSYNFETYAIDSKMSVDCLDSGSTGRCILRLELLAAPKFDSSYKCEVSEEGPRFEMNRAMYDVEVFVPPSFPQMEVSQQESLINVNCTATGIPAPRLVWRIGEQRIPETFSSRRWDFVTKLWHSWSVVTMSQGESLVLTCEVFSAKGTTAVRGQSVEALISSADAFAGELLSGCKTAVLLATFLLASLR